MERFIESSKFPIDDINKFSAVEKQGGGRPEFWEMVFWWTRKPLISARAIIAGALLPASYDLHRFRDLIKLNARKAPHREKPNVSTQLKELFSKVRLLDPFAGFGSIPLEAARLGLGEVVAVELLPTAYIFLKAILEYPKLFGNDSIKDFKHSNNSLSKDVERWGEWIIDRLRKDPDIKELYDEDVAVYIGSWEIKCPHCGNYTPLIGNWWLARVSKGSKEEGENEEESDTRSGIFSRLAWMEPYKTTNGINIRVVDLNKELMREKINAKVNAKQGSIKVSNKIYNVPKANIDTRRETAICLICNNTIKRTSKKEDWYIKEALREYNNALERYLRGEISLEKLLASKARPRILVRVKIARKELEFEPATEKDNEKLWRASEKLRQLWGDPDTPTELFVPYQMGTAGAFRITLWGFDKFYKLFNPRQLLTLVKLVKLIREAGKSVEKEMLDRGWDKEKAHKYAEAIATYLAIALVRYATFTSFTSPVRADTIMGAIAAGALTFRGIAIVWNWSELTPFAPITGSFRKNLSTIESGMKYLVDAVSRNSSHVAIVLDDASKLGKLEDKKFDLIVTDPPYRDDVPYAELSDFYYVWLKRALSDVGDIFGTLRLVPRFNKEAFFDEFGNEIETQWKTFALREVRENEGRIRYFGVGKNGLKHFKSLLTESFKAMASRLADDGLLITYYAHTSPDAWEALLEAGWLNSKMRVTAAYAIATESTESVVARGKIRLDMSIVAVWRKGVRGEALVDEVYAEAVEACSRDALNYRRAGFEGVNLFVAVLGKVLSYFTRYERLVGLGAENESPVKDLVEKYIYPATAEAIARSYNAEGARLSPVSMFYLLAKVLVGRRPRQARRVLDRTTSIILAIGTRSNLEDLQKRMILVREGDKLILLEPRWGAKSSRDAIEDTLSVRNLNPRRPGRDIHKKIEMGIPYLTAIDILHLLEYYAVALPKDEFERRVDEIKGRLPAIFEEATNLAKILAQGLPDEDPEKELAEQVLKVLGVEFGAQEPLYPFIRIGDTRNADRK